MSVTHFRDLTVWQKSIALTKEVYSLAKKLPSEELHVLSNQMRRAAISIPSNISEGHSRKSTKEFIHFLSIATGSKAELETQLILCVEIGYLQSLEIETAMQLIEEVSKMLFSLMKSLENRNCY